MLLLLLLNYYKNFKSRSWIHNNRAGDSEMDRLRICVCNNKHKSILFFDSLCFYLFLKPVLNILVYFMFRIFFYIYSILRQFNEFHKLTIHYIEVNRSLFFQLLNMWKKNSNLYMDIVHIKSTSKIFDFRKKNCQILTWKFFFIIIIIIWH